MLMHKHTHTHTAAGGENSLLKGRERGKNQGCCSAELFCQFPGPREREHREKEDDSR